MTVRCVARSDIAVFDDLAGWWDACPGPRSSVFLRTWWFRTIASHRLQPGESLHVVVALRDDEPVAVLPMARSGRRLRGLTEQATEVFEVVHDGDHEGVVTIAGHLRRESLVRMVTMRPDSPLLGTLPGPRWVVTGGTESARIDLPDQQGELHQQLTSSFQRKLRRAEHCLAAIGEVTTGVAADGRETQDLLARGLALELDGWKGREGVAVLQSDARTRFFTELAGAASAGGHLRLHALWVDDRLVAFNYNVDVGGVEVELLRMYDESLPTKAFPGGVLLWRILGGAISRRTTSYGLGGVGGPMAWKLDWPVVLDDRVAVTGFGTSLAGRFTEAAWRVRRRGRVPGGWMGWRG